MPPRRPPLSVGQILAWADDHHERTGEWPKEDSGPVLANLNEKWMNVANALRLGLRGLPGKDSLAKLLDRERGVRNVRDLPLLTEGVILLWATAHQQRTGSWPTEDSGAIPGTRGEVWANVDRALREGGRGLPGGDSLAKLLARRLGVRTRAAIPQLTPEQVLAWADAFYTQYGRWPNVSSGGEGLPEGEDWRNLDRALHEGDRGLPGGDSLARLLARCRKARHPRCREG